MSTAVYKQECIRSVFSCQYKYSRINKQETFSSALFLITTDIVLNNFLVSISCNIPEHSHANPFWNGELMDEYKLYALAVLRSLKWGVWDYMFETHLVHSTYKLLQ